MERKFILTESQLLERDKKQRIICCEEWSGAGDDIEEEGKAILEADSPSLEGLQEFKEEVPLCKHPRIVYNGISDQCFDCGKTIEHQL